MAMHFAIGYSMCKRNNAAFAFTCLHALFWSLNSNGNAAYRPLTTSSDPRPHSPKTCPCSASDRPLWS